MKGEERMSLAWPRLGCLPALARWAPHLIAMAFFFTISIATWAAARTLSDYNDFTKHVDYWIKVMKTDDMAYLPFFFYSLGAVTGFTSDRDTIVKGLSLIMGGSVAFRYLASIRILHGWPAVRLDRFANAPLVALAGMAIMVPFPIRLYNHWMPDWAYTNFPINVWHNSTYIFMMPFAVLLFGAGMDFLESNGKRGLIELIVYSILNVLSKPSFFLCFAPAFLFMAAWRLQGFASRLRAVVSLIGGGICLVALYFYIYHYDVDGGGIAFGFFHVWAYYAGDAPWLVIPLATANSLLLPLIFLFVYADACMKDRAIGFATLLLAVGFFIFAFIYETGEREYHGNMGWQVNACNYLLHVTVLGAFMRIKSLDDRWYVRDWLLAGVFAAQMLAGIIYLGRFAWTGSF